MNIGSQAPIGAKAKTGSQAWGSGEAPLSGTVIFEKSVYFDAAYGFLTGNSNLLNRLDFFANEKYAVITGESAHRQTGVEADGNGNAVIMQFGELGEISTAVNGIQFRFHQPYVSVGYNNIVIMKLD